MFGHDTRTEVSDHTRALCVELDQLSDPSGARREATQYSATGNPGRRGLLNAATHRACVARFPDFRRLDGACVCMVVLDSERR